MLSRIDSIIAFSEKVVKHFFLLMINPSYRGSNFSFDEFDIEDYVDASADMSFVKRLNQKEKALLKQHARLHWESCIKLTNVLNLNITLKEMKDENDVLVKS